MLEEKVHGTTISFSSSFFGKITGVDPVDMTREKINTSHCGSTDYMSFLLASLADAGEVVIRGNTTDIGVEPPIAAVPSPCTITGPNGGTIVGTAGMSGFKITGEHEEGKGLYKYEGTLVWTGKPAFTGGGSGT